ncbi:MAG TPA: DUF2269 family protein [Bacillota bacterium]|nr:DUF2269 family protein [Bacillota bacterium]
MSFYKILVFIHVISAIVGLGPGFILTFIVMKTRNMAEVRHAFYLRNRIHIFVMIGGILLLTTGLLMGFLNPTLLKQGWYITSLILFLLTLASGPFVLKPISIPIQRILSEHEGDEIPEDYYKHANRLFLSEHILNFIFVIIIILMILKPF